jgi:hypothetical protein
MIEAVASARGAARPGLGSVGVLVVKGGAAALGKTDGAGVDKAGICVGGVGGVCAEAPAVSAPIK